MATGTESRWQRSIMDVEMLRIGGAAMLPFTTGKTIFVDPANGSDGNTGDSVTEALATLYKAHDLATAGKNDVVVLIGDGSTSATARLSTALAQSVDSSASSGTLVWSKNATHLVAVTAPTWEAQRARISHQTSETVNINPLMQVTASGCIFAGFSFFQGVGQATTDEQLIEITGSRNYFYNIHFGGMGHQTGADRAGSYLIYLNGGGENTFERCAVGLETIQRGAANASVRVRSGAQRNRFLSCEFPMAADSTGALWVDANASGALNGSTLVFRDCMFRNLLNITGAQTPAVVATYHASVNGTIYFDGCSAQATKWAAAGTQVQVGGSSALPEGFNTGLFDQARDS